MSTMGTSQRIRMRGVLVEVEQERERQHATHGEQELLMFCGADWAESLGTVLAEARACQNIGKPTWPEVLTEEVCEALLEKDPARLRAELIQVAAVAVQWVEAIDRREGR